MFSNVSIIQSNIADLTGITSIAVICLINLILALNFKEVSRILFVALSIRIFLLLINYYIFPLPDTGGDVYRFEHYAWIYAKDGLSNGYEYYINDNTLIDSDFISLLIAIPYSFFGRSILMAQSISLFFGMGVVFIGWLIAVKLWGKSIATKVGWFLALFPTLVLYSVLVLREVYACFFLLIAIYGIINWVDTLSFRSIIITIFGFIGATMFHGAMFIGLIVFIFFIFFQTAKEILADLTKFKFKFKTFIMLSFIVISTSSFLIKKISIPKIGTLAEAEYIPQMILNKTQNFHRGSARYPDWLVPKSEIEILYKGPVRIVYFLFSPFPWNVEKPSHLIGIFDSSLYVFLTFLIFKNRKVIWNDPKLRIIFLILLSYILVYGISVGNFGTAIRHRSKFVTILFLLVAPLLPKLIFSIKNMIKKI